MYAVVDSLQDFRSLDLLKYKLIFTKFTLPNKPKKDVDIIRIVNSAKESKTVGYYNYTISVGIDIDGIMRFDDLDDFANKYINRSFEIPGLTEVLKNYGNALVKRIFSGVENCPENIYNERLSICNSCPFLTKERECSLCGCPVDTKAKWASEQCPASPSKWSSYSKSKGCNCSK